MIFFSIRKEHGHLIDSVVKRQFNIPLESADDPLAIVERALRQFRASKERDTAVVRHGVLVLDDIHFWYVLSFWV